MSRHSPLHQEDASMDSQISPYSHHVSSSPLTFPTRQVEPSIKYGGNDTSTHIINGVYGTDWSYDTVARYQAIQSGGHNDNARAGGTAFALRREHNYLDHIPSAGGVEDSYSRYIEWPYHPTGECLLHKAVCSSTSGDGEAGSLSPVPYPANMPQVPGSPNICHPTIHLPPPVPVHTQLASKTAAHSPARLPHPRDGPLLTPSVAVAGQINPVDSLEVLRADVGLTPDQPLSLLSLPDRTDDCKPEYSYHILIKLAILGSLRQRLSLQEIYKALRERFKWYKEHKDDKMWQGSIRHQLSLRDCFVAVRKPLRDPGHGFEWIVDYSRGDGIRRGRKRKSRGEDPYPPPLVTGSCPIQNHVSSIQIQDLQTDPTLRNTHGNKRRRL
ncbi:hypothetical protein SCP_0102820 [Sparassis crispa]|uniref:Fork-head domain-containing protein n=1 Tax=Sparassis crispa TaxID=139825 RepID=A0A401G5H2_9APHY|nr:hypothetical protein SCP_0102820 [Sparassis crispa]GBE77409.1 hypothetical protein SCP_0102820 [Sparassis crispa]